MCQREHFWAFTVGQALFITSYPWPHLLLSTSLWPVIILMGQITNLKPIWSPQVWLLGLGPSQPLNPWLQHSFPNPHTLLPSLEAISDLKIHCVGGNSGVTLAVPFPELGGVCRWGLWTTGHAGPSESSSWSWAFPGRLTSADWANAGLRLFMVDVKILSAVRDEKSLWL